MLPKIKRFIKRNKKVIRIALIILLILIVLLSLYKMLFYSDSERAVYGSRLNNINENKITKGEKKELLGNIKDVEGITDAKIEIKGRLIKIFAVFESEVTSEDIKAKFTGMLDYLSESVKSYYDVTFYAKQEKDDKETYPVIGYKQKGKELISFDEF